MVTFVLVHGAWLWASAWDRVADILTADGYRVVSPCLTGLGEKHDLLSEETNLNTHIADVAKRLEQDDLTNVVMVGHGYAGMIITGIAGAQAVTTVAAGLSRRVHPDQWTQRLGLDPRAASGRFSPGCSRTRETAAGVYRRTRSTTLPGVSCQDPTGISYERTRPTSPSAACRLHCIYRRTTPPDCRARSFAGREGIQRNGSSNRSRKARDERLAGPQGRAGHRMYLEKPADLAESWRRIADERFRQDTNSRERRSAMTHADGSPSPAEPHPDAERLSADLCPVGGISSRHLRWTGGRREDVDGARCPSRRAAGHARTTPARPGGSGPAEEGRRASFRSPRLPVPSSTAGETWPS